MPFQFYDLDNLSDGEIELRITSKVPPTKSGFPPSYYYKIYKKDGNQLVGTAGIRLGITSRTEYLGHIEYDIIESYRGNNYAAKAVQLLKQVAIKHELQDIIITSNVDNIASRKTIEKIGGTLQQIQKIPLQYRLQKKNVAKWLCIYNVETMKGRRI